MTDPVESIALATTISNNLPPVVKHNLVASLGALISAVTDVPVAWLEGTARRLRAHADADIAVLESLAQKAVSALPEDLDTMERAKNTFVGRIFRSQKNRDAIATKAIGELSGTPPGTDAEKQIDPDWIDMFSRIAETKSNEEMQAYFARLLAGEIRKPGTFSPATVEALSRLTPDLADSFNRLCSIATIMHGPTSPATSPMVLYDPFGNPGTNKLEELGFSFSLLSDLTDAGLVQRLEVQWTLAPSILAFSTLHCGCEVIGINITEPEKFAASITAQKTLKLQVITFTRAGCELFRIQKLQPHALYLSRLKSWLTEQLIIYGLKLNGMGK